MPDESFQGMQNLAQVYTAARQARAQNPTGSRFDVAMQGIAQAQELSDPLFPLRKKTMEMNLQEMALQISNQITAKQMQLDDAKTISEAGQDFLHRTPEEKLNYPTPTFKTPQAQLQWSNFMKMNLGTEAVTQLERLNQADADYFVKGLAQLEPDQRASIQAMTDKAKQMQALTIALESKKRQTELLAQEAELRSFEQKRALAEIAAKSRETVADITSTGKTERQAYSFEQRKIIEQMKLEAKKMTESQFILSKSVQAAQALGTTEPAKVKAFLQQIYSEAKTEGDTVTPTPVVPRKTLHYDKTGKLISGS